MSMNFTLPDMWVISNVVAGGLNTPGKWTIERQVSNLAGNWFSEAILATNDAPNGWTATIDSVSNPTQAAIHSPLNIGDFELLQSLVQRASTPNAYSAEDIQRKRYQLSFISSQTDIIGSTTYYRVYASSWYVTSYGPKSEFLLVDIDTYSGSNSEPGRRQIFLDKPTGSDPLLVDTISSITTHYWELWSPAEGFPDSVLVQSGTGPFFEFDNELEPGEEYTLKLTTTNSFGKAGTRTAIIDGKALAAYYDRATGMIRVMYKHGTGLTSYLRYANYPKPQKPILDGSNPQMSVYQPYQAPHSTFRYGAQIYAFTSTGHIMASTGEGYIWPLSTPDPFRRLYGMTITPDGTIFQRLYKPRVGGDDNIYWSLTPGGPAEVTGGLDGFSRPSKMLNIGTGYVLIAKLGNDVVCAHSDNGKDWTGDGVVSPDSRLVGAFKTADHSIVSVMVIPRGESPQMVRLFNTGDGWDIQNATPVTGLPTTLRTPADIDSDGVRTVLVYTDGNGHGMATSDDLGITWTVEE